MPDFLHKKCVPCEGGVDPLTREKAEEYLKVVPGWSLRPFRQAQAFGSEAQARRGGEQVEPQSQGDRGEFFQITREFKFKDFKQALAFVNTVADIAESEGHHPNIYVYGWNKVRLELYTHAIKGLSDNDFIIAAKINNIYE